MPIRDKYRQLSETLKEKYSNIPVPDEPEPISGFSLPTDPSILPEEELERWLLLLAKWRGWIASNLAEIESDVVIYEEAFNILLGNVMANLQENSISGKKLLKESLQSKAIIENEELSRLKEELVALKAEQKYLISKYNFFDKKFEAVSRVVTSKGQFKFR